MHPEAYTLRTTGITLRLFHKEGFHVAVGGVEARDWGVRSFEKLFLEGTDCVLGDGELVCFLEVVVNEGDAPAEGVDLGDVSCIDDIPSADTEEMKVREGGGNLQDVLETRQKGDGSVALDVQRNVIAIAGDVDNIVEAYLGEFVTGAEINGVGMICHNCYWCRILVILLFYTAKLQNISAITVMR